MTSIPLSPYFIFLSIKDISIKNILPKSNSETQIDFLLNKKVREYNQSVKNLSIETFTLEQKCNDIKFLWDLLKYIRKKNGSLSNSVLKIFKLENCEKENFWIKYFNSKNEFNNFLLKTNLKDNINIKSEENKLDSSKEVFISLTSSKHSQKQIQFIIKSENEDDILYKSGQIMVSRNTFIDNAINISIGRYFDLTDLVFEIQEKSILNSKTILKSSFQFPNYLKGIEKEFGQVHHFNIVNDPTTDTNTNPKIEITPNLELQKWIDTLEVSDDLKSEMKELFSDTIPSMQFNLSILLECTNSSNTKKPMNPFPSHNKSTMKCSQHKSILNELSSNRLIQKTKICKQCNKKKIINELSNKENHNLNKSQRKQDPTHLSHYFYNRGYIDLRRFLLELINREGINDLDSKNLKRYFKITNPSLRKKIKKNSELNKPNICIPWKNSDIIKNKHFMKIIKMAMDCRSENTYALNTETNHMSLSLVHVLKLEDFFINEEIEFPNDPETSANVKQLCNDIQETILISSKNKRCIKEELKEHVNEYRFGESESSSFLSSLKFLFSENRKLKPKKTKIKKVDIKKQSNVNVYFSLLKPIDLNKQIHEEPPQNNLIRDTMNYKQSLEMRNFLNRDNNMFSKYSKQDYLNLYTRSPKFNQRSSKFASPQQGWGSTRRSFNEEEETVKFVSFLEVSLYKADKQDFEIKECHLFKTKICSGNDPEFNQTFQIQFQNSNSLSNELLQDKLGNFVISVFQTKKSSNNLIESLKTESRREEIKKSNTFYLNKFIGQCSENLYHLFSKSDQTLFFELSKPLITLSNL